MLRRLPMFCACVALAILPARAQVAVNEIVAANDSGLMDENGDFSDWFELYNTGDAAVNLEGWGLSDSGKRPFQWVLHGANLGPHAFMTIFASGKDRQPSAATPAAPNQID